MELIRGLTNLRPRHRGCVASIGNFDGVHLGHQLICHQLKEKGYTLGLPVTVVTFEPHPQEYFQTVGVPERISSLRDKLLNLQHYNIDRILLLKFGSDLANLEAEEFIQSILLDGLGVRFLMIGDDFRFGKQRRGDLAMLQEAGQKHDFTVGHLPTFTIDGQRVSSTRIRGSLRAGDLQTASRLLGRGYSISGRVVHGDKQGRAWGTPTANINLSQQPKPPLAGIFAVLVHGLSDNPIEGVASIGTRPTLNGVDLRLEVHLFDFNREIYGIHIRVEFCKKLRDEEKFSSIDALRKQMERDTVDAARYFSSFNAEVATA